MDSCLDEEALLQNSGGEEFTLGSPAVMRGSEANQQTELGGSCTKTAFSDPDLIDPLPLLFSDLLTLPT